MSTANDRPPAWRSGCACGCVAAMALDPREHQGVEFAVSCWAEETDDGKWLGMALVAHRTRLDFPEVRHDFDTLHDTRLAALYAVRDWAIEHYPPA